MSLSLESMASLMSVTTEESLLEEVKKIAFLLGFDQFLMGVEISRPQMKPIQHISSGYPLSWQHAYAEKRYIQKDPTVSHCQMSTTPLVWNEEMYGDKSRDLWEDSKAHGISHGLSIPIHERGGVKSMFSIARDQSISKDQRELKMALSGTQVLAACAHLTLSKIIVPELLKKFDPQITKRERECLLWAAKGKTAFEIGVILHIAEATAVFHLNNVMRKFNVANRVQAIAIGVAMGLIE